MCSTSCGHLRRRAPRRRAGRPRAAAGRAAGRRARRAALRGDSRGAAGRRGDDQAGGARRQRPDPQVAEEGVPHDCATTASPKLVSNCSSTRSRRAGDAGRDQAAGGGDREARRPDAAPPVARRARCASASSARPATPKTIASGSGERRAPTGASSRSARSRPVGADREQRRVADPRQLAGESGHRCCELRAQRRAGAGDRAATPRRRGPRTARGACARRRCGTPPGTRGRRATPVATASSSTASAGASSGRSATTRRADARGDLLAHLVGVAACSRRGRRTRPRRAPRSAP